MGNSSETKRLWRTALIVAGIGVVVLIPLAWLGTRFYEDSIRRRVVASNEAATLSALGQIQAAQHLYFQTYGQYATFPQLVEAGVFQAPLTGDALVANGYTFTLKVRPQEGGQAAFYSVNADPLRGEGREATGRRHFYADSEVTGIRVNEGRPASASDPPRQSVQQY